ncbi:dolichol monophosphate mannose synthase [Ignicoccus pacificus DSM 13166]|uniref:Dolichol-phosphate mannosyltransferase n=1 Tax=Ignicoccus pacificus DSM 13166 TaxID=940294 RepID=A0A977PIY6_9CREN|nr:dolichol monophosphate mannose synthase [Ignicoccus pacificus DSM 13166]
MSSVLTEVSVIVPTYKERENIVELAKRLDEAMREHGIDYELVVVDDNSPDGTAEAAMSMRDKVSGKIKVIVRKNERGLASAVLRGFKEAEGRYLIVMDADLQHPPEVVPKVVEKLREGCDIVVASRYTKEGGVQDWSLIRRIISKGATWLAWIFLPRIRGVTDPMSGFFGLRREIIEENMRKGNLNPKGFKILLEILAKAKYEKICEVPYVFQKRFKGESKLDQKVMMEYLIHLIKLAKETGELRRMITFATIGAGGVVVNEGTLYLFYELLGLKGLRELGLVLSAVAGFEASVIFNFILHETITFREFVKRKDLMSRLKRLFHYHNASVAGLVVQVGTLVILTNLGVYYLLANLIGIFLGLGVRYSLSVLKAWGTHS